MNTTTIQTITVPRRIGAALLIGGLIAASAAGPGAANRVAKATPRQATAAKATPRQATPRAMTQPTRLAPFADAGLNLALGSDYPTASVRDSAPLANLRFQGAVGSNAAVVGAPSSGDPGLGVLFGSTANEAAWASIRYSPNPGLSLMFSQLYPVR